jgi:hypothetical protein
MKQLLIAFILTLAFGTTLQAQNIQRRKIAIFAPLYLDSAFDASGNVRTDRNAQRLFNPGLEFYYGAQMALDSLQRRLAPLDVYVYDSRSREPINQQLNHPELNNLEMIIAASNSNETRILADAAVKRKIPFISTNLPNDAGITNNPYFVILNSTLQSHIEGIYRFLQKYHSQDRIIVFRKSGAQEDQIKSYFTDLTRTATGTPLNIKYVDLGNDVSPKIVLANLDSTRRTYCIAGSLDENFGAGLIQALAPVTTSYPVSLIGMPTWERINFNRPELSNLEIIYSTPFYYNHNTPIENQLTTDFAAKISAKPTDMFFRGYETTLRFALLLLDTKKDIASNLTRKGYNVITQFDIQPVFKDKSSMTLDYFENKHLYFIKVFGGVKNILF